MAIIKCKMCGGDIELTTEKTYGTCEYCGSTMTLPKIDDEQRAAAFNRGNHFRRIGEFDKALAVYERIVREDDTDAEAHWCCALCRFGIEYVEDPASYEYLPTCHRASFDSFLEDVDYLAAVEYSQGITKRQYQKDGAKIAEVQRGILATSQNTEPYDVFICYKESDESGGRTRDSLMAQDIYYQLTEQGRKVFFARITLEDVAGAQYEPYIFAALNSAKVMIVVGTKPEHLNAVWVKNEWSRFLAMMKKDRHKLLLPCYRDMDPYDMPEQLSVLQSYDMAKIGFIQDLTRGIAKVLDAEKKPETVKETVVVQQTAAPANNTASLLKRAFMFLEDGNWNAANEYCEKVLDIDPENARAYLGKLMAELKVKKQEELKNCAEPFDHLNSYQKTLRFADKSIVEELKADIDFINERNEQQRLEGLYLDAMRKMGEAKNETAYKNAAIAFAQISGYRDADERQQLCLDKAKECAMKVIYDNAVREAKKDTVYALKEAVRKLERIRSWFDANQKITDFESRIKEIEAKEEAERQEAVRKSKRNKKIGLIVAAIAAVGIVIWILTANVFIPNSKYNDAIALMDAGKYYEAISAFEAMEGYKDSDAKIAECNTAIIDGKYNNAVALMDAGEYEEAIAAFEAMEGYKDSYAKIAECNTAILDGKYNDAVALMEAGKHKEAAMAFVAIKDYKDAREQSFALWEKIADRETVSAGYNHTVGLRADGTVVAIGENDYGERNVSTWTDIVAVSAGSSHTVGLRADGTVVAAGNDKYCDVSAWTDIVAVSAGCRHTVGLRADGTVVAVGDNEYGGVSAWTDIVAVSAGKEHTVGLRADGTVVAVGDNSSGQCNVSAWTDIVAISAGFYHTVGLRADGTVVAVGNNSSGQCNVSAWTDIVAVSAGSSHTVGLRADGTVVAVGNNSYGQCNVSTWTDIIAVSADWSHTVGLRADGTVVAVGDNDNGQCDVSGWKVIKLPNKFLEQKS